MERRRQQVSQPGQSQLVRLSGHDVHVWFLDPELISSQVSEVCFHELLCEEERGRCLRFVFDRDRHTYLVARSLLRKVLSRYRPDSPQAWRFVANEYGKPRIEEPPDGGKIHFNLTHTRGLVALAVAHQREVGIDAEHIERSVQWKPLAQDVLADQEIAHLESVSDAEQCRIFFRFWTLKEAYIKACGKGLSIPLRTFWFRIDADRSPRIRFTEPMPGGREDWLFFLSDRFPMHELAVAVEGSSDAALTFFSGRELF
jgi:4'-phosphopantetheinyl transferase